MELVLDNLQLELLEISFWGFYLFILTKKKKREMEKTFYIFLS